MYTDVAYLACARQLLAEPDAIYPQFATNNAHTLSAVYTLAGDSYYPGQYEFQCLHGMGEALYSQVVGPEEQGKLARPCRIYAPSAPMKPCWPIWCGVYWKMVPTPRLLTALRMRRFHWSN